jgi:hypothetical protein
LQSRAPANTELAQLTDEHQEEVWVEFREAAKSNLYFLNKAVLGFADLKSDLHQQHCNFLQLHAWNSPYENANLKVSVMPRNHFKSTSQSVGKPIWFIINDPQATINLISAVEENTIGWMDAIQKVFRHNQMFRWLFPELIPDDDKFSEMSKTRFTVPRDESLMPEPQPTLQATSIVSGQASKHVKHVILDDPVNEMTVDSPRLVDRAVNLYKLLESTLQDFSESSIDLTATPWGFGDVIENAIHNEVAEGKMLYWKIGCYGEFEMSQALAEAPDAVRYLPAGIKTSQLSTKRVTEGSSVDIAYANAEVPSIFPERYPPEELERLERKYGTFLFSCNYRCDPFDPSQSGFAPDYLGYFTKQIDGRIKCECHPTHEHYMHELHLIMTVDPAFSDKDTAAESAIVIAGTAPDGCRFLFKAWGAKVETDELWKRMMLGIQEYAPYLKDIGVEAVASQKLFRWFFEYMLRIRETLPPEERELLPTDIRFEDLRPDGDIDKIRRIKFQQTFLANGQWHIQAGMSQFLSQYNKFPRARPVDILDAWAYCDYMWDMPRKETELPNGGLNWNQLRRDFHKKRRPYS